MLTNTSHNTFMWTAGCVIALANFSACHRSALPVTTDYFIAWHDSAPVDTGAPQLWSVSSTGAAHRIDIALPCGFSGYIDYGDTGPYLSPNGQWIAFGIDRDLWLYRIATGDTTQVTHLRAEPEDSDLPVTAVVHSWSGDSSTLFYSIFQPPTFTKRTPQQPSPRCGYYGLDLNTMRGIRKSTGLDRTAYPLRQWLPTGAALVSKANHRDLYISAPGSGPRQVGTPGIYGQLSIDRGGARAVAFYSPDAKSSQIVVIDLHSGKVKNLSPSGTWAQFQRPSYSPSEKRVAYIETDSLQDGMPVETLVVDSDRKFSCDRGIASYKWLNDDVIVLTCRSALLIVDASSGTVMNTVPLGIIPCTWAGSPSP